MRNDPLTDTFRTFGRAFHIIIMNTGIIMDGGTTESL